MVKLPKSLPRAFHLLYRVKGVNCKCASMKQWLTKRLWGEGVVWTTFRLLPLRKLGSIPNWATNSCYFGFCANQWACSMVIVIFARELACCWVLVNELRSINWAWITQFSLWNRLKSSQYFQYEILGCLHNYCSVSKTLLFSEKNGLSMKAKMFFWTANAHYKY